MEEPETSKETKVIEFIWDGPGTIPDVKMLWMGARVIISCPRAMMVAYQQLEEQLKEVTKMKLIK